MSRDLTTTREQVFGDVGPGTECRICGRAVEDYGVSGLAGELAAADSLSEVVGDD